MLLQNTTMQHPSSASISSTCKGTSAVHGVNLRVSAYRPANLVRSPPTQKRRTAPKPSAQAAEVVAAPEQSSADDQNKKKKIAIFVEPSPFSHVSGKNSCERLYKYRSELTMLSMADCLEVSIKATDITLKFAMLSPF